MTLFIALGNSWVLDSGKWKLWRGAFVVAFVALSYSGIAVWISPEKLKSEAATHGVKQVPPTQKPPTLLDLFMTDFPTTLRVSDDEDAFSVTFPDGEVTKIRRRVYMDFEAKTKFVGFYVSSPTPPSADMISGDKTLAACLSLAEHNAAQKTLDDMSKRAGVSGGEAGQMTDMQDLTFSGRVFIYHEDFLSITQKADIIRDFKRKHLDVNFRGPEYLANHLITLHHKHDPSRAQ